MAIAQVSPREAKVLTGRSRLEYVGYLGLAAIVAAWSFRAFHDRSAYDTAAAWEAGRIAWVSGHPEILGTWTGMPFLAAVFALLSNVLGVHGSGQLITVLNVTAAVAASVVVLRRMRPLMSPLSWWIAAYGVVSFVPLMSSIWWKQFNVIALALGLLGFELLRRQRLHRAAAVIGISIAIKPMVVLLPFVLLARRHTRRAGAEALAWIIGLNVAAQVFIATRAHDVVSTMNPFSGIQNFLHKATPNLFLCHPVNFSPGSLLCRTIGGMQYWTLQRIAVWCGLLLMGAWVVRGLRGRSILSWECFAFSCALSAMLSPFEWTHYQVMLAPLFLLLLFRFAREGAGTGEWAGLALAFVLASLVWEPYGTLAGTIQRIAGGARETYNPLSGAHGLTFQEGISQFAQYILVVTGTLWYASRRQTPSAGLDSTGAVKLEPG
jgi:hypothetical protein